MARRDDREYWAYLREEPRSQPGCAARELCRVSLIRDTSVPLVTVPHLPKTYLDGPALKLGDGTPVVGLTLRYDRLDRFWFCLLHELADVGRHMDVDGQAAFVDDLSLRDVEGASDDPREAQADEWAEFEMRVLRRQVRSWEFHARGLDAE
jgi:HTH-type transcriptional regulator / antitoxin HigA